MTIRASSFSNDELESRRLAELDEHCDRFEEAWCAGENPRIEAAVEGIEDPLRDRLLQELITLEVAYRRQQGESPKQEEYETRFPNNGQLVQAAFSNEPSTGMPSDLTATVEIGVSKTPSERLEIRCPSCQKPIQLPVDASLREITCESCGSHFSLVDQSATTDPVPLFKLGRFEILERVGMGGFGSVWKAYDKELDRTVAIKIPRQGSMTPKEQERFHHEARAVAQLRHPNIVSLYEVGRSGDLVYIVSEFVQGVTLDDWIKSQRGNNREVLELCARIADALHHAHEAGIVHRDLKPSNILIDSDQEPHLMDFGLARREIGEVTLTLEGQVLGTPAYMSPEQARGEAHLADRRSDIYSLGVILFQLLTGERPFRGNAQMLVSQVLNDEPPSPRKLDAQVSKDLETITLKCLEKEPSNRYPTSREVAEELRRYLSAEPIQARPIGLATKLLRLFGKRRYAVALVVLTFALVGSSVGLSMLLAKREAAYQEKTYLRNVQLAYAAWQENDVQSARELLSRSLVSPGGKDRRDFAWHYLWSKCEQVDQHRLEAEQTFLHDAAVSALAISGDGGTLASVGGGVLRIWNTKSGTLQWEKRDIEGQLWALALNNDGSLLVSGGDALRIWNLTEGSKSEIPSAGRAISCVAFSSDEAFLATGHKSNVVKLWDLPGRQLLRTFYGHTKAIRDVAFSPDGRTLASGDVADSVRLWDVAQGEQLAALVGRKVAFAPNGHMFAAVGRIQLIQLWDISSMAEPEPLSKIKIHGSVTDLTFADNRKLSVFYDSGEWELCDALRGEIVGKLHVVESQVDAVAVTPHATLLATATSADPSSALDKTTKENMVKLWRLEQEASEEPHATTTDWLMSVALEKDGKSLAMANGRFSPPFAREGGVVNRVSLDEDNRWVLPDASIDNTKAFHWLCLELSPDQQWLACGGYSSDEHNNTEGIVVLQSLVSDSSMPVVVRHKDWVRSIAFSNVGKLMAVGGRMGPVALWDLENIQKPKLVGEKAVPSWSVAFSYDDQLLLAGGGEWYRKEVLNAGKVTLMKVPSLEIVEQSKAPACLVTCVLFLPDGQSVAAADYTGHITFYDSLLGNPQVLPAHDDAIRSMALSAQSSPSGVLATAGLDGEVKLWHVATRTQVGSIPNNVAVYSLSFDNDGRILAGGRADGTVKLWHTEDEDCVILME